VRFSGTAGMAQSSSNHSAAMEAKGVTETANSKPETHAIIREIKESPSGARGET